MSSRNALRALRDDTKRLSAARPFFGPITQSSPTRVAGRTGDEDLKTRAWEATGRAEAIFFLILKNNRQTRKNGHVAHRSEYSRLASLAAAIVRFPSAGNERYSKATLWGTRLIIVPLFERKLETSR